VYKSKFEAHVADQLKALKVPVSYETDAISYVIPESTHKYKPDWKLPNGAYIESKGIFDTADRQKILLVKKQHPDLKIYLLFYNANAKLYKRSKTSYAEWCDKNGIEWSHRVIKKEWLK
jgi:hypothetical protein